MESQNRLPPIPISSLSVLKMAITAGIPFQTNPSIDLTSVDALW